MDVMKGLSSTEVDERRRSGQINSSRQRVSRSYTDIIVKNVCTRFNMLLFILGAAFVFLGWMNHDMGQYLNALAATGIIVMNILIATFQEIKAKRRLDKIALLLRPKVTAIRDGVKTVIDQAEIVKDDVIDLKPGEQALVDGVITFDDYLEMDESLLTGESRTVRKRKGDRIYSGSFCIAGEGYYVVDAFGDDSFASKMLASAQRLVDKKTPLQIETNTITVLLMILAAIYIIINLVGTALFQIGSDGWITKFLSDTAVIMEIVPIALFLLIVITYMIAAVRMADKGVLLQTSSSVESISHVDTVCMDKTGTITTNKLKFNSCIPLSNLDVENLIKKYLGASKGKNKTASALEEHYGSIVTETIQEIRFTSERKYSSVRVKDEEEEHVLFLGASNVMLPHFPDPHAYDDEIEIFSSKGLRTVFFGRCDPIDIECEDFQIPDLEPIALFVIEDEVRPDCKDAIDLFLNNGTELKVISGDDPATVDALFSIAGIPGERKIISGDELDMLEGEEKNSKILETNIFGRMRPDQKEDVITTLRHNGRYVAMVGDGVNDVKSLKKANVGIALESGSAAARSVADMVLVKDNFSALPKAVVEGKRTVSGMRDILKIYISRNFTMAIIIAFCLIILSKTPLNPIQNVYYAFLSVSASSFFMAIWAKPSDNSEKILPAVLKYAIPTAISMGIMGLALFAIFGIAYDKGFIEIIASTTDWTDATRTMDEALGSAVIVLFLTLCGILQLLVVVPFFKLFSINGERNGDIKPFLLMLLLLVTTIAGYNVPVITNLMSIPIIPWWIQLTVFCIAFVWIGVQRMFLKWDELKRIDSWVQKIYAKALERNKIKEMNS